MEYQETVTDTAVENKEPIAVMAIISLCAFWTAFASCFAIYYSTIKDIFMQTYEFPHLAAGGWIGLIAACLIFLVALLMKIFHLRHSIIGGAVMAVLSIMIIVVAFLVQWWMLYAFLGIVCLIASVMQMFNIKALFGKE